MQANPGRSVLTLEAESVGELEKAMQHVAYLNSRQFPTPGVRRLRLSSTVRCVRPSRSDVCAGGSEPASPCVL